MAATEKTITVKLLLDTTDFDTALDNVHERLTIIDRVSALRVEALTNPEIDSHLKALGLG